MHGYFLLPVHNLPGPEYQAIVDELGSLVLRRPQEPQPQKGLTVEEIIAKSVGNS